MAGSLEAGHFTFFENAKNANLFEFYTVCDSRIIKYGSEESIIERLSGTGYGGGVGVTVACASRLRLATFRMV